MYQLKTGFGDHEVIFDLETIEELVSLIKISFRSGYAVEVAEIDDEE